MLRPPVGDYFFSSLLAEQLARFAALFADRVIVPSSLWFWLEPGEPKAHDGLRALGDIAVLLTFKPLLLADIVRLEPNIWPFCESHDKTVHKPIVEAVSYLKGALRETFHRKLSFTLEHYDDHSYIQVSGIPSELNDDDHGRGYWVSPRRKAVRALPAGPIDQDRALELGFAEQLIDEIADEVFSSYLHAATTKHSYLTHRKGDFSLLASKPLSSESFACIQRPAPKIVNVPVESIVRLRTREREVFDSYRDAINRLTTMHIARKDADSAFEDVVGPELRKLDVLAITHRRKHMGVATRALGYATAFIGFGALSGILPPEIGAMLASVGGFGFGAKVVEGAVEAVVEPPEVKRSELFFLWKLLRAANG